MSIEAINPSSEIHSPSTEQTSRKRKPKEILTHDTAMSTLHAPSPKKTKALDHLAFEVLYTQVELAESRMRDYMEKIKGNGEKVKFLEAFKSEVRAAKDAGGGKIDWENDQEKMALIEKAKECGVVLPKNADGTIKFKWDEKDITTLLLNVDSTIDPLNSANDKDKVMLGWFQNKQSEWITMLTNIMKKYHEMVEYNLRNW